MYFELSLKRTIIDKKGNDKNVTEKWLVDGVTSFGEAEQKGIDLYNNEADIIAVKISPIECLINKRKDNEQSIYSVVIENIHEEDGKEKITYIKDILYANNLTEATRIANEYYVGQTMNNTLVSVKKTKFIDIL